MVKSLASSLAVSVGSQTGGLWSELCGANYFGPRDPLLTISLHLVRAHPSLKVMTMFKSNLLQICFNYGRVGTTSPPGHYSSSCIGWFRESGRSVGRHHQHTLIPALSLGSAGVGGGRCEHHCQCLIDQFSSKCSSAFKGVESVKSSCLNQ